MDKNKIDVAPVDQDQSGLAGGLLDAQALLKVLWPNPNCRPSLRWLRERQKHGEIPFIKLGNLVFFLPDQIRAELANRALRNRRK